MFNILNEVRQSVLDTYENADYQYDHIVEDLNIERVINRSPLFDVSISYISFFKENLSAENEGIIHKFTNRTSKNDINLICTESQEMNLEFEYCNKLFKPETMKKMACNYETVVRAILANPNQAISDIAKFHIAGKSAELEGNSMFNTILSTEF